MTKQIDSPIFRKTRHPTYEEALAVRTLLDDTPVCVFMELNKYLNTKGMMLTIAEIGNDLKPEE